MILFKISSISDAIPLNHLPKAKNLSAFLLGFSFLILCLSMCSCSSTKGLTQTVREVSKDTIFLSNIQYDSIYINNVSYTDCSKDTVFIRELKTEFKYKLLRDTIYKTKVDSIPYKVTITEVREVQRPLTWFDHLTRTTFWLLLGFLCFYLFKLIRTLIKFL